MSRDNPKTRSDIICFNVAYLDNLALNATCFSLWKISYNVLMALNATFSLLNLSFNVLMALTNSSYRLLVNNAMCLITLSDTFCRNNARCLITLSDTFCRNNKFHPV